MGFEVERETFNRELPRLLAEGHKGKYALIKGGTIYGVWDTQGEAVRQGYELLPLNESFMTEEVTDTPKVYYLRGSVAVCRSSPKT